MSAGPAPRTLGATLLVSLAVVLGAQACFVRAALAVVGDEHRQYDVDLLQTQPLAQKTERDLLRQLQAAPAWRAWQASHPGWRASWNPQSGTLHRAWGPGIRVAGTRPNDASIEADCRELLQRTAAWSGIDPERVRLVQAVQHRQRWYVVFEQVHDDIPIVGARVDLRLDAEGRLMLLGADWTTAAVDNDRRTLDTTATLRAAQVGLPQTATSAESQRTVLVPVPTPQGTTLRLADELVFRTTTPVGHWYCLVDAQTGTLLRRENRIRHIDVVGSIAARVEPRVPGDPQLLMPLQDTRLNIGSGLTEFGFTDSLGAFQVASAASDSVNVFLRLAGLFARVFNDDLGRVTPRIDAKVLPGSPVDFVWDDSNSRASERDAYKHTLIAHDFIKQLDPGFTGVDYIMPVVVDIGGAQCNAWYDGFGINFLAAGPRCVNTARIADVVYHEYGHAITDWQYRPFAPSGAMHEAFSDYLSATMRDDPTIGNGFYGPGTIIRSIDNTLRVPDDLTGQPHADGLILGGALWDLRQSLGAALTDTLFHFARYGVANNFDDYMLDVLVTDDDNGNLFDGTPNFDAIVDAFEAHGIGDYSVHIAHDGLADTEDTNKPLVVHSAILSLFPLESGDLTLRYRVDEGAWQFLPLQEVGGVRMFEATLPLQATGATLDYRIEASDSRGNEAHWPGPDDSVWHRFRVGPDTTPPSIQAQALADRPLDASGWPIRAHVVDNLDRALDAVDILWSRGNNGLGQSLSLVRGDDDMWFGTLPNNGATLGDIVHYAIVATDSATTPNTARMPLTDTWSFDVVQGFLRDLEADDGGFAADGDWQ